MSKEKEIVSINGQTYPISKCRKFEKGYYLIGQVDVIDSGDCYLINGKYYRFETGQITFDYELLRYVLLNDSLISGIVGFENKKPIVGYFTKTNNNLVIVLDGGQQAWLKNLELIADQKQYREKLSDGKFYHINTLPATKFNQILVPRQEYKTSLPYDSGGVLKEYLEKYNNVDILINHNIEKVTPLMKDLSFGLEFETTAGFIPDRILNQTGLIPLRDGSIPGIEYVTVPMTGAKGLQTVVNASKELEYRTKYDNSCALHLHIGNVPRTPEFILAMFKATCAFQDEMYSMFPLYKKYNFGIKNKNYSKPYPVFQLLSQMDPIINSSNIKSNFDVLYSYLSMGESFRDLNYDLKNVKNHPADREGRAKWNVKTRYYLNNMIPLIFGNKQTIEFRIHTGTLNDNKIIMFVLLNSIIVNFVIENTQNILENPNFLVQNSKLMNLLNYEIHNSKIKDPGFKDFIYKKLAEYFGLRKDITASNNNRGDIVGDEDKIKIGRPIDFFKVVSKEDEVNLDLIKTKKEEIHAHFKIEKQKIVDEHSNRRLSTLDARHKVAILEDQRNLQLVKLSELETENSLPW